jgi:hypothetical protein
VLATIVFSKSLPMMPPLCMPSVKTAAIDPTQPANEMIDRLRLIGKSR